MRARPSRVRRLRIRKSVENVGLALVVLILGSAYLALQKHVTLVVDGQPESVRTMSGSVGELLHSEGIVLDRGVVVEPPAATPLADGMTVVVDTEGVAAPVLRAPSDVGVWVVEGVSGPLLRVADPSTENWFSAGDAGGSSRVVDARVVVKGKAHDVLTNATTVRGLNDFPKDERPPVFLPFAGYHLMILLGLFFIMMAVWGAVLLVRRKIADRRVYLRLLVFAIPLPYLANELGWVAAEVGRQPWAVHGVLKTADAASVVVPAGNILFSLVLFAAIYALIAAAGLSIILRLVRRGLTEEQSPPSGTTPSSAGPQGGY